MSNRKSMSRAASKRRDRRRLIIRRASNQSMTLGEASRQSGIPFDVLLKENESLQSAGMRAIPRFKLK